MFALDQQKKKNTKPFKKQQTSKKVQKTIFYDPFHYKIQLLPSHEDQQLQNILSHYLQSLREEQVFKPASKAPEKFISFTKKEVGQKLSPLVNHGKFMIGVKKIRLFLLNWINSEQKKQASKTPQMVLVFYEEKKHELVQSLLCLLKLLTVPFLLIRQSKKISHQMGVKNLSALCLFEQKFALNLYKYIGKCLIDIPQIVDTAFSFINQYYIDKVSVRNRRYHDIKRFKTYSSFWDKTLEGSSFILFSPLYNL